MICPFCAEEIKDEAILCRYCKKDIKASRSLSKSRKKDNSGPISKLKKLCVKSPILVIIPVTIILAIGGFFGAKKYSAAQEQKRIIAEEKARIAVELAEKKRAEADNSWVPEGFTKFSVNPYVAWKTRNGSCGFGKCLLFKVVSNKSCSNLYVEGNALIDGVVVDWANDTVKNLSAGQEANLKFQFSNIPSGGVVDFTEAECY